MTDVKRLLAEATPLPWELSDFVADADDALIVYAVNRLPDYEAAVEALEGLLNAAVEQNRASGLLPDMLVAEGLARAALARLREKVPA